jgi:predicted ABC-type ATPase
LDLAPWGLRVQNRTLQAFVRHHALAKQLVGKRPVVRNNVLLAPQNYRRGYFIAILCDFMRRKWLEAGESFTFETVMSHPDKVRLFQEGRARGYRTYLYFVCTDSPLINRERIDNRVALGGHDVSQEKLESRYQRSLLLLSDAVKQASRAYLFDNSGKSHRLIAEFDGGILAKHFPPYPDWYVQWQSNRMR